VLETLGVGFRRAGPDHGERIVRLLLVTSKEPVPELLRQLQCYGLGLDRVGPNHVCFAGYMDPWFSGGTESIPVEVAADTPVPACPDRVARAAIAVFDSGLLSHYETLAPWLKNIHPVDPQSVDDENQLDIYDNHGLFVGGIIGYTAPNATIVEKKILSEELGEVDDFTLAQAIGQYLDLHTDVHLVNLSLGGTTMDSQPPLAMQDLVWMRENVVFVASAGNAGSATELFYPAALPRVVRVGALDQRNQPAPFSNSSLFSAKVWAHGVDVVSAFHPGKLVPPPSFPPNPSRFYTTGLAKWSGTSFSAPRVTAVLCDYVAAEIAAKKKPTGY